MKPTILEVGTFTEGTVSGVILENWKLGNSEGGETYTLGELKELAHENGSYVRKEGAILDNEVRGIRWYGDDPFGD